MLIDQLFAVDASTIQFAQKKSVETIPETEGGFAAYLARVMNPADYSGGRPLRPADRNSGEPVSDPAPREDSPGQADKRSARSSGDSASKDRKAETIGAEKTSRAQSEREKKASGSEDTAPAATLELTAEEKLKAHDKSGNGAGRRMLQEARATAADASAQSRVMDAKKAAAGVELDVETMANSSRSVPGFGTAKGKQIEKSGVGRVAEIEVVLLDAESPKVKGLPGNRDSQSHDQTGVKHQRVIPGRIDGSQTPGADRVPGEADLRGNDPRKRVSVRDLRTQTGERNGPESGTAVRVAGVTAPEGSGEQSPLSQDNASAFSGGERSAESLFAKANGSIPAHKSPATLQTFRQALSEQLNGEIVRAARMVVRGQDSGEIRLHLKPESLGNVRIRLEMQEGHIAGRIIVENSSVREVFEQNLGSLIKAFNESGLQTGTMDIMLSDSGSDTGKRGDRKAAASRGNEFEQAVPQVHSLDNDHELVDLVV